MTRPRSHSSFASLIGLVLFSLVVCVPHPTLAATDDEVFSKLDTNEDGVLSGKEATTVRQFDADKDGEVTKAEYLAGIVSERKALLSINDSKLFAERDTNEDDVLSGKEIKGFENYDADSDGEVSRKEFDQGRAADRKKIAGPSPEELARQALEKFRQLDINEDGRLSGKEMVGFEKLDGNGDKRISEKEFVAGFATMESEPAGDPVAVFLEMIRTTDPTKFLKVTEPGFAKEMDPPVLKFVMERVASALGTLEPSAKTALVPKQQTINDQPHTVFEGSLEFKNGKADATLIVNRGQIVGFQLQSPALNDVGERLLTALATNREFGKTMADFYTPHCEEFVKLILAGEDEKAFAKYHPETRKQVDKEQVLTLFEILRTNCGDFKGFELEKLRVESDADGNSDSFVLTHLVRGSKRDYLTTMTFQFSGLSAHVVILSVKPADKESPSPSTEPGKPGDLQWVKTSAAAEGVTFEMPGKPKRTADESKNQVSYRFDTEDKSSVFTVRIESEGENQEPEAKTLFEAVQTQLVKNLEGELLDTDEANAGRHPGRIFFLQMKDGVFFIERTVIIGRRLYRLQVVTTEQNKRRREKSVNYFFESAKFLDTDDDVPAPPSVAPPKSPPKPPSLPKPPVP